MKFDYDLMYKILLSLENDEQLQSSTEYTKEQIGHHIWLMGNNQYELLELAKDNRGGYDSGCGDELPQGIAICLSARGHSLLKSIRTIKDQDNKNNKWDWLKTKPLEIIETMGVKFISDLGVKFISGQL